MRRIYSSRADSLGITVFSVDNPVHVPTLKAWDMMPRTRIERETAGCAYHYFFSDGGTVSGRSNQATPTSRCMWLMLSPPGAS
jgi:hypothetical protein